jgi:glycosyltransferase involved in cell wall biosynthesis
MLRREGKPIPLKYEHVICVSAYVRQRLLEQGLIPADTVVIHNGVDLSVFSPSLGEQARSFRAVPIACLVAGRIVPDKGIHTVIDAFALLREHDDRFTLTVLGDGPQAYIDELRLKVEGSGLRDVVTFHPPIPRSQMPEQLSRHNVLLLPSEYAEPIARSMQEAMAMGLLVIGTITGGSGELLVHEQTGLVFRAGDPQSLASKLARVATEPELAARLAHVGQQTVCESFTIGLTVERIEQYLRRVCENQP